MRSNQGYLIKLIILVYFLKEECALLYIFYYFKY